MDLLSYWNLRERPFEATSEAATRHFNRIPRKINQLAKQAPERLGAFAPLSDLSRQPNLCAA